MKYDAIVVGSGSAGCMTAYEIAKNGYKVLLIDRKPRKNIGNKICGNALGNHHLKIAGLTLPDYVISNKKIDAFYIYSSSGHNLYLPGGEFEGVMLRRPLFGQYLLSLAEGAGAEVRDNTKITGPILENDWVKGVKTENREIYSDVVIDCSGLKSPIRLSLGIEPEINREDVCLAYREIRRLKEGVASEYCNIYIDQEKYPLGYAWIFPQDEITVNVGLGVGKVKGYPHPRQRLYDTLLKEELFKDSEIVSNNMGICSAGMDVPVRRSLNSLVRNGIMFAGEAGICINPLTAGGNGPALVSGKLSGEVASKALEKEDASIKSLWEYNRKYFSKIGYGAKYFSLDVFRILLQHEDNKKIDYAIAKGIITGDDLLRTSTLGEMNMNITKKAWKTIKGIGNIGLLKDLNATAKTMKEIKQRCTNYPDIDGFNEWENWMNNKFAELKKKFPPYSTSSL